MSTALEIVKKYYAAFNQQDWDGMLALVHPNIRHEPNQGEPRLGKDQFREFLKGMDEAYQELLTGMVYYPEAGGGNRVAVEFTVNGIYKKGEAGFPPAKGQTYELPAAAFLEVKDGLVIRVATHYNLPLWVKLVSE
ncbi:nuclear transport factor 2 family protein [Cesiribacter andamanensis]|uniref:Putative ester cyclase n=1 Tax=Cesiribacter andamanensis AMV16 TaxID=1279009 RepID=M7NQD7_9BACT|nr:nuclear transport factor 2 family protein [Cesiribacter andamanensis]EMR00724.1 putative ester cyclase [Cesiribacter andamanensis AMV16]